MSWLDYLPRSLPKVSSDDYAAVDVSVASSVSLFRIGGFGILLFARGP